MNYREFLQYLEFNLDSYPIFLQKAQQYQQEQNAKRQKRSQWNDEKIKKAAYEMWKKSMETLYNNLKREIKSDSPPEWTSFIENNNILEMVNDSISEMDFSNDAA